MIEIALSSLHVVVRILKSKQAILRLDDIKALTGGERIQLGFYSRGAIVSALADLLARNSIDLWQRRKNEDYASIEHAFECCIAGLLEVETIMTIIVDQ